MSVTLLMADVAGWCDSIGRHPISLTAPPAMGAGAVEMRPAHCANGHDIHPPNFTSSWLPCTCAGPEHDRGHRVVGCGTCGHEWFYPAHTDRTASVEHWATAGANG